MKRVGRSSIVVAAVMLTVAMVANAQQPTKVPWIGYLSSDSPSTIAVRIEAFRQGLRELGNVEGKDIVIEWRVAKGKLIGYLALLLNWSASR